MCNDVASKATRKNLQSNFQSLVIAGALPVTICFLIKILLKPVLLKPNGASTPNKTSKENTMRNTLYCLLFSIFAFMPLANASPITSEMKVYVVAVDEKGKETLTEQENAEPGQMLEYHMVYSNVSKKNLKITNADGLIPKSTEYVSKSANSKVKSDFLVSIDQGKTFEKEPVIRQRKEAGKITEYVVPVSEYTNVRWMAKEKIKPNKKQIFKYRVKVQ